jgi:azurin
VLAACASDPPAPGPEQLAVFAEPVDIELVVPAVRNALRFSVERVEAPAGATVRLVMDNTASTAPAMVHNVVVVRTEADVERVGRAAAGVREGVPLDEAVVTLTPLAAPGERTAVVFTMPPPGEYPFVCTYPGHYTFMQGVLVSTPPE